MLERWSYRTMEVMSALQAELPHQQMSANAHQRIDYLDLFLSRWTLEVEGQNLIGT